MPTTLQFTQKSHIIFSGYFNLLKVMEGENPAFKKHSVGKIIDLKETFDRTDVWRIKNPETKQCTFRGKHVLGFLQRHL